MIVHHSQPKPEPWSVVRGGIKGAWKTPFLATEYAADWLVFFLSNWRFLEALEYLGSLSILIAVIFYFAESGDRVKQRHYQAWQVINTAQGKGGSGGRIEALQELAADKVPLTGVDVSGAFLQGLRLENASLVRANFHNADVRNGSFVESNLSDATLAGANFRKADLRKTLLRDADLSDADLSGALLQGADLSGSSLENADLQGADLQDVRWQEISSVKLANLYDVKNAPADFVEWALKHGAVQVNPEPDITKSGSR